MKVGEPPSPAMIAIANRRGLELAGRATWASPDRIAAADLIVCMDHEQAEELARDVALAGTSDPSRSASERIRLLLEFAPDCGRDEVPDPHGLDLFAHEQVADLIEQGVEGIAQAIANKLESRR
jgi:protein-tyrosine phosphatase